MEITIYCNHREEDVYTEEEFYEVVHERTEDIYNNEKVFDDYLDKYYEPSDIFNLTEHEKEEVKDKFYDYCRLLATEELLEDEIVKHTIKISG